MLVFRSDRKIAQREYYIRHVSARPSVHTYGTAPLPLEGFP